MAHVVRHFGPLHLLYQARFITAFGSAVPVTPGYYQGPSGLRWVATLNLNECRFYAGHTNSDDDSYEITPLLDRHIRTALEAEVLVTLDRIQQQGDIYVDDQPC